MLKCQHSECEMEAIDQWFIRFDSGMVERMFCWNHSNEYLPADKAAFGDRLIPGSMDTEVLGGDR